MKVVVIGAGFAGLAAALRLRQAGAEVTVVDSLERAGGKAALGFPEFSSGPTVVTMPQVFRALHARLGWPAPDLAPAVPTTTYHAAGGRTFAPQALHTPGALERTLKQLTWQEAQDYRRLLRTSRRLYEGAASTFLFSKPPGLPALARYGLRHGWAAAPGLPLSRLVQSGPFLTPFWLRFATYLGANPYRAPAVLHNIAWVELGGGVWHLPGGLLALAGRLHAEALRQGVTFEFGTQVEHLHTGRLLGGKSRVVGAQTSRGTLSADAWVSAADHHLTARWLGRSVNPRPLGVSGFALQLRLHDDQGQAHHIYWPGDYAREWQDIEQGELPRDPTLYLHLDGQQGFLLVNAPPHWAGSADAPEYARFLLRRLQARHPLPIADYTALSPRQYARTALGGALYGNAPHGLSGSLRPAWNLHGLTNLVQVGGTVYPGGGVPLSMLSGWNGAASLLHLPFDPLGGPAFTPFTESV
ncbi:phytoene desaturase family protein [Deinococcus fonticola]|uniref:phytoene desaturase family protein n=1 Tax=Deinococcus fonticola TaxID=2528713 RepID=UPI0010755D1E|nr:NAD(P)/FAD-dependent oxidoreductase [Deinococcus fonticola]